MLKIFTKKTGQKGFTLVELLVVIAIIGILAGIVLVAVGGARVRARNAQRMSSIRAVQTAMEMYYDANNWRYFTKTTIPTDADLAPFLDPFPVDPLNRAPYVFGWIDNTAAALNAQEFCIFADLEGRGFFAASRKGTRELPTAPTVVTCW